jgi:hypothetical protein
MQVSFLTVQQLEAGMTAITILILGTSLVPLILAWQRSPSEHGSVDDADFWTTVAGSLTQLLSFVTIMLPISRYSLWKKWRFAWFVATLGTTSAIAAPILYLFIPLGWSFVVAFLASSAQASLVLQIMLKSDHMDKRKRD